jgi:putative flippase GtrA
MLIGAARRITHLSFGNLLETPQSDCTSRRLRRYALKIRLAGFLAGIALLTLLSGVLFLGSRSMSAQMLLILAIGFPARYCLDLWGGRRRRTERFRLTLALSGLGLVGMAISADGGWRAFTLAFALREWIALGVVAVAPAAPTKPEVSRKTTSEVWAERGETLAQVNQARTKRLLTTRLSKVMMGSFLGPLGPLVFRTARGAGADRLLLQFIPVSRRGYVAASILFGCAGTLLLLVTQDAWAGLIAASLLSTGSAFISARIWSGSSTC